MRLLFLGVTLLTVGQPAEYPYYVSQAPGVVTRYGIINYACPNGRNNNIALLSEERTTGMYVVNLKPGYALWYDGIPYEVARVVEYTAFDPLSVLSVFQDRQTGEILSSMELAELIYCQHPHRLIIQTCIDGAKGRLFVIAYPRKEIWN